MSGLASAFAEITRLEGELEEARTRIVQLERGYDEQRDLATARIEAAEAAAEEARQERDAAREYIAKARTPRVVAVDLPAFKPDEAHARIQTLEAALREIGRFPDAYPYEAARLAEIARAALQPTTDHETALD